MQDFDFQPIASSTPGKLDLTAGIRGDDGIRSRGGDMLHFALQDGQRCITFRQTVAAGTPAALV